MFDRRLEVAGHARRQTEPLLVTGLYPRPARRPNVRMPRRRSAPSGGMRHQPDELEPRGRRSGGAHLVDQVRPVRRPPRRAGGSPSRLSWMYTLSGSIRRPSAMASTDARPSAVISGAPSTECAAYAQPATALALLRWIRPTMCQRMGARPAHPPVRPPLRRPYWTPPARAIRRMRRIPAAVVRPHRLPERISSQAAIRCRSRRVRRLAPPRRAWRADRSTPHRVRLPVQISSRPRLFHPHQ